MDRTYRCGRAKPASRNPSRLVGRWLGGVCLAGFSLLSPPVAAETPVRLPGLKPDQQSLVAALAGACPAAAGELAVRCRQLQALGPAQQRQAILSLTPYQFLPQTGMPVKLWPKQIWPHSRQDSGGGNSLNGMDIDGQKIPLPSDGNGGGAGGEVFRDGPLGLIVQGKFQTGGKHVPLGGFSADAYELTVGVDYRFTDQLVMGSAFAYNHTETTMEQDAGNMRSNIYRALLFGDYFLPEDVYVNWLGIYTAYDNNLQRKFGYAGYVDHTASTPNADLYSLAVSIGKDFQRQEWLFGPYLRMEYLHLRLDAYREQGGQGLAYAVGAQADDSLILIPGFQLSHVFSLPWGVLTPSLRFEYEHQFLNDKRDLDLRLADAPVGTGRFFLSTGAPDRDYCNLGGAVTATFPGGAAFLHYETRLGQTNLSSHIVELGVRVPF